MDRGKLFIINASYSYFTMEKSTSDTDKVYNPKNINSYHGTVFRTVHDSEYFITEDGKIKGRPSIDGAEIMLIAGLPIEFYDEIRFYMNDSSSNAKKCLEELMKEHGQEPKPGLMLVISLTPEDTCNKQRYGMMTSPVERIIYLH